MSNSNDGFKDLFSMFGNNDPFVDDFLSSVKNPNKEIIKDICSKCGSEYIQMMDRKKCSGCGRIIEDTNK